MTKKVLISTGGSGGHVIPAITIYNHLKNDHETFISTDARGLKYLGKNKNVIVILRDYLDQHYQSKLIHHLCLVFSPGESS